MDKVRILFVGCGGIADYHLGHLVQFDDVEYAAFCDLIPERAQRFVERTGQGKAYTDYARMMDEVEADAIYICVPPTCHGGIEEKAIEKGLQLFVEKPMTLDMDQAVCLREQMKKAGIITCVGFQDRYLDVIDKAKEYLADRPLALVTGAWLGGVPGVPWWRTYATSGGQIVEQNIHLFDMMRYLVGEPDTVYAAAGRGLVTEVEGYDVDDYSSVTITFKNGVVGNMLTGCFVQNVLGDVNGLTFYARDARIEYQLRNEVRFYGAGRSQRTLKMQDHGVAIDRTFIAAVKTNDPSIIRSAYEDAMKSLAFTLACNESIRTGKPVKVIYR